MAERRLLLLGLMGSGKTTIGRIVAERTGWTYIDNDREIAAMAGVSTVELAGRGGTELHDWEATYAQHVAQLPEPLVAGLPGSVADRPELLVTLHGRAVLVYLRADVDTLVARVRADAPRPWLDDDPRAFVEETSQRRDPVLLAAADAVIDAARPVDVVVDAVLQALLAARQAPLPTA